MECDCEIGLVLSFHLPRDQCRRPDRTATRPRAYCPHYRMTIVGLRARSNRTAPHKKRDSTKKFNKASSSAEIAHQRSCDVLNLWSQGRPRFGTDFMELAEQAYLEPLCSDAGNDAVVIQKLLKFVRLLL